MRRFTSCLMAAAGLATLFMPAGLSAAPGFQGRGGFVRPAPPAFHFRGPHRGLQVGVGVNRRGFGTDGRGFGRFGRRDRFGNGFGAFGLGGFGGVLGGTSAYGEAVAPLQSYSGLPGLPVVVGIPASPVATPTIYVIKSDASRRSSLRRPAKSAAAPRRTPDNADRSGLSSARIIEVEVPRG